MKIVIPGGSGQVGTVLARHFHAAGHEVVVLSRNPQSAPWRVVAWDGKTSGDWTNEFDGADVVINLAGRSVNCRYHSRNRKLIKQSRIDSTRAVGNAILAAGKPPRVWLQASTASIYSHRYDADNDDITGELGGNEPRLPDTWKFSLDVAHSWEATADSFTLPQTRLVKLRSAMMMSPDAGGVFDTLFQLTRWGLGGRVGSGKQFVSWIHDFDFCRAIDWVIDHSELTGAVNLSSPNPLPYAEFMRALRKATRMRMALPAAEWMLECATFFLRTESELVLKSRRVVPARLLQSGFEFLFPEWEKAAGELARRSMSQRTD